MLEALLEPVFKVVVIGTGHGLIWALTLGRCAFDEKRDTLATVVGLLFWAGVVGVVLLLVL
jgi:hypothetical protein